MDETSHDTIGDGEDDQGMSRPKGDARGKLLTATMEYIAQNGVAELSLRQLAITLGTSHRMLIYHFESKEGLIAEVVAEFERQYQAMVKEWIAAEWETTSAVDELRQIWRYVTDPSLEPYERLFFEFYGQALQGRVPSAAWLKGNVDAWLVPLTENLKRVGMPHKMAQDEARLTIAVFRGLQLDYLATGNRAAASQAMERFLSRYEGLAVGASAERKASRKAS